jgi:hypothetical protein
MLISFALILARILLFCPFMEPTHPHSPDRPNGPAGGPLFSAWDQLARPIDDLVRRGWPLDLHLLASTPADNRETTVIPLRTLCLILAASPQAETTIIVGAGDREALAPRVARWTAAEVEQGRRVLSQEEILASLRGVSVAQPADVDSLARTLAEADRLEAYFDTDGAQKLRDEVLRDYERTRDPSAELLQAAARALHGIAAGYRADGDHEQAFHWAKEAERRFPGATIDTRRHAPPTIAMLSRAAQALGMAPTGRLLVTLTEPGEVLVDGRSLGHGATRFDRTLPAGRYVLRVVSDAGTSFPRPIEIEPGGRVELAIDSAFERCVRLVPRVTLTCADRVEDHLQALMIASGADRAIGIFAPGGAQDVREVVLPRVIETSVPDATAGYPPFTPLYLLPFGGGQFTQGRYGFGAAYAAAGAGAVAWHVVSRIRFARLNDELHVNEATDASSQVELSFWVLAGTAVVTVAEALIVGWLYGGTDFR